MHRLNDRIDPSPLATLPRMAVRVALGAALLAVASGSASSQSSTNPAATPQHSATVAPPFTVRIVGQGAPIILIPGLMSSDEVWDGTVAHLGKRYQLHIVRVAGFAGTPASVGDDFPGRLRDSLVAYARTLRGPHAERPVIVGHSFGGFLAYAMAAATPDAFDGIVAVDGVPFLPALQDPAASAEDMRPGAERLRAMFASINGDQLASQSRAGLSRLMRDTSNIPRATEWARTSSSAAVGQAIAEMMTTDLRAVVSRIRAPVLQLAAGGTAVSPAAIAQLRASYEAQITGVARHEVIVAEHAYHFIMLDDPDFFHATLDAYLARVETTRTNGDKQ